MANSSFRIGLVLILLSGFFLSSFPVYGGKIEGTGEIKVVAPKEGLIDQIKDFFIPSPEPLEFSLSLPVEIQTPSLNEDTIFFAGTSTPGAEITILKGPWVGKTIVSSSRVWKIENVPIEIGKNDYFLIAKKEGESKTIKITFYRESRWERAVGGFKTWVSEIKTSSWRIISGEPQELSEYAASLGLDLIVIGDLRDIGKQSYLYIHQDPEFDALIGTTAVIGILTTVVPTGGDQAVSVFKNTLKAAKSAFKESPEIFKFFKESSLIAFKKLDTNSLKNLFGLVQKLKGRDIKIFEKVLKNPEDVSRLAKYVGKEGDEGLNSIEKLGKRFDERDFKVFQNFATIKDFTKIGKKFGDDVAEQLVKNSGKIDEVIETAEGILVKLEKDGIFVEVRYIDDGKNFIEKLGGTLKNTNANKGFIGEQAADYIAKEKGWGDVVKGFKKDSINQIGIDRIYKQGDVYIWVESKLTSEAGNVGKGILSDTISDGKQLSDKWIRKAILEMKNQQLITPELAEDLRLARITGKIRKELVVVKNVPMNGKTVLKNLTEEGLDIKNIHLININEVIK